MNLCAKAIKDGSGCCFLHSFWTHPVLC